MLTNRPTDAQVKYLTDLLHKKDLNASEQIRPWIEKEGLDAFLDRFIPSIVERDRKKVSGMIDHIKSLPNLSGRQTDLRSTGGTRWRVEFIDHPTKEGQRLGQLTDGSRIIPAGKYALETPEGYWTNDVTFFKLWIGDRGGWNIHVYGSDTEYTLARSTQYNVLNMIAIDPAKASTRYGHEVGSCGVCGRKLTNDASRARGIGPVCAQRVGW